MTSSRKIQICEVKEEPPPSSAGVSGVRDGAFLKATLKVQADEIRFSATGELPGEHGMPPVQCSRRFAVTKKIETARPVKEDEIGFQKVLVRYRERVGLEIGKASEYGARWWSRRLVEVCEEAGLVRLEK
jgi:hypothetical protein